MNKRHKFIFVFLIALVDLLLLHFSLFLSQKLFYTIPHTLTSVLIPNNLIVRIYIFWTIASLIFNLYLKLYQGNLTDFYRNSWRVFLLFFTMFSLYIFEKYGYRNYNQLLVLFSGIAGFILFIDRIFILVFKNGYYKFQKNKSKIGIIGFNTTGINLAETFENDFMAYHFEGILDESSPFFFEKKEARLARIAELIQDSRSKNISELYLCESPELLTDIGEIFSLAEKNCIKLKFIPHIDLPVDEKIIGQRFEDQMMFTRWNQPLEKLPNRIIKRLFDIFFSLFVIIFILSWLYPIIGLLIKWQSPGPILFKQKRSGMNNEVFTCLKFRSMRINSESDRKMATFQDPRITRIGAFIRKTSIDELPQFFNVLLGEMTIVGPRPHMVAHTKQFNQVVDNFMVRHFIKPGITGLAQISGLRGEITLNEWQDRINFDLEYLEKWSIFLDIKICFITLASVFKGDDNAY
jgi:putative colanic acid biosysnthesis UDP-glucose lipid carrier transferase